VLVNVSFEEISKSKGHTNPERIHALSFSAWQNIRLSGSIHVRKFFPSQPSHCEAKRPGGDIRFGCEASFPESYCPQIPGRFAIADTGAQRY